MRSILTQPLTLPSVVVNCPLYPLPHDQPVLEILARRLNLSAKRGFSSGKITCFGQQWRARIILAGDVPSAIHPPSRCPFHPRCLLAEARCRQELPILREVRARHWIACHQVPITAKE
jgi:oligopeptide/dipeptide ABC transporter ATP-binding protein